MGLVDGFFLLGLFLIGVPIAGLIGAVLGKILGMPRLAGCLPGLVLLVVIFGFPVSLALSGVHATAHVISKIERVPIMQYTGNWYHQYNLHVQFRPSHPERADAMARTWSSDSVSLNVAANEDQFDAVRKGSLVDIVYLPYRPSIGKLANRSFAELCGEMLVLPGIRPALVLLIMMVLAISLSNRDITNVALRQLRYGVYVALVVSIVVAGWTSYRNPESVLPSEVDTSGVARVVNTRLIDRTLFSTSGSEHSSSPLAQPFEVVELEYLSPRNNQLVRSADAIDSGTLGALRQGQQLRMRFNSRAPRTVRLEGGARTFRETNAREIAEQVIVLAAFACAAFGILLWFSRWKKKMTR